MRKGPKVGISSFARSWLLFFLALCLWAQLTPLGSAPDEAAHLIKSAAVVRGEWKGEEVPSWLLSIDGWVYDSAVGVAEVVVVSGGNVVQRQDTNIVRDDIAASQGTPPDALIGFSIWVIDSERKDDYSIFARLRDGRLTPIQVKDRSNVIASPTQVEVAGTKVLSSATTIGMVETSQFNGRMEYSHWSTYVKIEPQFDAARTVHQCFASQPTVPGCGLRIEDTNVEESRPITTMGRYTPLVYMVPGIGTLLGPSNLSWVIARLICSAVAALFIALSITTLLRRRASVIPLLVCLVPAVLYLGSTINPSGIEITSAIAVWVSAPGLILSVGTDRWERWCFALGGLGLILTRPIGMVLFLIVLLTCTINYGNMNSLAQMVKRNKWISIVHLVAILFASWWYLFIYNTGIDPRRAEYLGPDLPRSEQIVHSIGDVWRTLIEATSDLGSLEVQVPRLGFLVIIVTVTWLMSTGLRMANSRNRTVILGLAAVCICQVIATNVNYFEILRGFGVQGRHVTPLLVGLLLLGARSVALSPTNRNVIASVWVIVQFIAAYTALRRYSVGMIGTNFFEMFYFPVWRPLLDVTPSLVLITIALVAVAGSFLFDEWNVQRAEGGD